MDLSAGDVEVSLTKKNVFVFFGLIWTEEYDKAAYYLHKDESLANNAAAHHVPAACKELHCIDENTDEAIFYFSHMFENFPSCGITDIEILLYSMIKNMSEVNFNNYYQVFSEVFDIAGGAANEDCCHFSGFFGHHSEVLGGSSCLSTFSTSRYEYRDYEQGKFKSEPSFRATAEDILHFVEGYNAYKRAEARYEAIIKAKESN